MERLGARILVQRRDLFIIRGVRGGYEAHVDGKSGTWEAGSTPEEAVRKLVDTYRDTLSTDISVYKIA